MDASLFFRALQHLSNRIHNTDRVEHIMLDLSGDICDLFQADRMTLYTVSEDGQSIASRIKTGLQTIREIRLPINAASVAGYVALHQRQINVPDAQDEPGLRRIAPDLSFQKGVDKHSGYTTHQLLTTPILLDGVLYGVLQLVNTRHGHAFDAQAEDGAKELCQTLAIAFKRRLPTLGAMAAPVPVAVQPPTVPVRYQPLVQHGWITPDDLDACLQRARQTGRAAEDLLREHGVPTAALGDNLAAFFGVPYAPYTPTRLRVDSLHGRLKREFVTTQQWLPLEDTPEGLQIMCLDPEAVANARLVPQVFPQAKRLLYHVTTQQEFAQTVEQIYGSHQGPSVDSLLADMAPLADDDTPDNTDLASAAADNELVKLVNKIIMDAYQQGASDIHIEPLPGKAKTTIRFRVDGTLRPYIEVPAAYRAALVTRLKIMCDLDIAERRKPQDGKIAFKRFAPLDIELRVATLPSNGGVEDVVLRLLASGEPLPLEKLGLSEHNRQRLLPTIEKPYGLFYVCGPTGSGKTTTLHSILKHLNTPETKIWTAEDPVEITQKGLRQVQVNKKAGLDFATVMRAFLRADPDIIMVGESRDHETVSMGVEASLTGHLVLSTLHTNSAPESIVRLLDMGMDPFNFADALLGVLAQRLAKRLCNCKQAYTPDEPELAHLLDEYSQDLQHTPTWHQAPSQQRQALRQRWHTQYAAEDGRLRLYRPQGCERCQNTGYKGRVGLHELLLADDTIRERIQNRARVADLLQACLDGGMHTLKMDGIEKALQGLTDMKQIRQVCVK